MFVLKDEVRTARKFYDCDASEMWRSYGLPEKELAADERLVLDGVKADKWKIRPGQRYRCVVFRCPEPRTVDCCGVVDEHDIVECSRCGKQWTVPCSFDEDYS